MEDLFSTPLSEGGLRIPIGQWVADGVTWVRDNLDWLLSFIALVVRTLVAGLTDALVATPFWASILIAGLLAWAVRSWQMGVGTIITFTLIVSMGMWEPAMQTLALVLIAALIAILVSIPLGIWSARNATVRAILKPILDFMQTMPAYVYLIPAIVFFSIGVVPGVIATMIFSLPPGVRLTELGIRGVDGETVEAGQAFGASPGQILRGIQLPLAVPTIMAGVNQVIMLALSMAVIAGIAGADGLGKIVVEAISTINIGRGVEAGLGVVFLAVFLDRVTAALGNPSGYKHSLAGVISRSRTKAVTGRNAASDAQQVAQDQAAEEAERKTASPHRHPIH